MIRCIIICAGEGTRWNNYLGTPKHLIELEGERLLDRLVRQISSYRRTKIHVVVKEKDSRYRVRKSRLYIADLDTRNVDADKFLSSRSLWNKKGRTIVFYGDVWFTDEAIEKIMSDDNKGWTLYGRHHPSKYTGCAWGECFAQSFYPDSIEEHEENLYFIADEYKKGRIERCGGWEHYRAMAGLPLDEHSIQGRFNNIDDFTDDFDVPDDYHRWVRNRLLLRMNRSDVIQFVLEDTSEESHTFIKLASARPVDISAIVSEVTDYSLDFGLSRIEEALSALCAESRLHPDARNLLLAILRIKSVDLLDQKVRLLIDNHKLIDCWSDTRLVKQIHSLMAESLDKKEVPLGFRAILKDSIIRYGEQGLHRNLIDIVDHKTLSSRIVEAFGFRVVERKARISSAEELDDILPEGDFVIKPEGGDSSHGVYLIRRRGDELFNLMSDELVTIDEIKGQLDSLSSASRITHSLLIEELIEDYTGGIPQDFKAFCFYGEIGMVLHRNVEVVDGEFVRRYKFWDESWNDIRSFHKKNSVDESLEAPSHGEQLIQVAKNLSSRIPIPFIRIDFYIGGDGPVFGEFTCHPGYPEFYPMEIDTRFGILYEQARKRIDENEELITDFLDMARELNS